MEQQNEKKDNGISVLSSFKVIISEAFSSTTAHALPNIFRTSNILIRIIWLLCFLASSAYCFKSIIVSIQDFLEYPSYVSTETVLEIPTQFPAVTFCNLKYANKTTSSQLFSNPKFPIVPRTAFNSTFQYMYSQEYLIRTALSSDIFLNDAQKRLFNYDLEQMLVSCTFNYKPCFASDFVYFHHPYYGSCYTFNKGANANGTSVDVRTVSLAGSIYGLIVELFLGKPDEETKYEFNDGVVVSVHNQSAMAFTGEAIGIMAGAGADTDVVVTRNFISKLEAPYKGNCLKDTSKTSAFTSYYFNHIVKELEVAYSQSYCFQLCVQKQIKDTCNCSNIYLPSFKNDKNFCMNSKDADCLLDVVYNFGKNQANDACKAACPFECESVEYYTSTARSLYPTQFYKSILLSDKLIKASNVSTNDLSIAVAKVNVYYKNMLYTRTTENIQTSTEDIFSNVGGTLGLYIGISLLSVVELVELAINLLMALVSSRKRNKTVIQAFESDKKIETK